MASYIVDGSRDTSGHTSHRSNIQKPPRPSKILNKSFRIRHREEQPRCRSYSRNTVMTDLRTSSSSEVFCRKKPRRNRKAASRVTQIDDLIGTIRTVAANDLKDRLSEPLYMFRMAQKEVRSLSEERMADIRAELERESRFHNTQFKKNALTKDGFRLILNRSFYHKRNLS